MKCIRVASITVWALTLTGIVCGHAVDAGASGDFELVCGIVTATARDTDTFSEDTALPPLQHAVADHPWQFATVEDMIPGSTWRTTVTPAQVTVPAVIASDTRELVTLGAQLVSDLVAEFGQLPSDPLLSADGLVISEHCIGHRLAPFLSWARKHAVLDQDQQG